MIKNRYLFIALAALVLIALLAVAGLAVHYVGWSEGYAASQQPPAGEGDGAVPYAPFGLRFPGRPHMFTPFYFGGGPFLRVILLLVLFALIFKLFRFVIWGIAGFPMMAGMMGGPWHRHWRRMRWHPHGPVPPGFQDWHREWQEWCGPQAGQPEPDAPADEPAA